MGRLLSRQSSESERSSPPGPVCVLELADSKENWGDWERSREPPERMLAESKESIYAVRLSLAAASSALNRRSLWYPKAVSSATINHVDDGAIV